MQHFVSTFLNVYVLCIERIMHWLISENWTQVCTEIFLDWHPLFGYFCTWSHYPFWYIWFNDANGNHFHFREYISIAEYLLVKKCLKSQICTVYTTLNPDCLCLVFKICHIDWFPELMKCKPTRSIFGRCHTTCH